MEQVELEVLVTELELRIDRLRSLYDQYFMGIEKIAPAVPRKDVERRIQIIRKEQIRNTGLRFRFQMILQRFNTYQTYWQRICRDIENGTYKRHMMRAQARFGPEVETIAKRRRSKPPGASDSLPPPASTDAAILEDEDFAAFAALESPRKPRTYDVDMDFGDLGDPLDREPSSMRIPAARSVVGASPLPPPLPLPSRVTGGAVAPAGRQWRKAAPAEPRAEAAPPAPPPARPPPPPPAPARAAAPPAPRPAPPAPTPRAAAPPAPRPAPPAPTPRAAAPPAPRVAAPASPAAPPLPPPPKAPPPKPPAPTPPARPSTDLPDERVRQLYAQYVETKRKHNESTAAITYDNLAKSLRESSAKLREKHGRAIDFEVAVKDGKTILKPVVK